MNSVKFLRTLFYIEHLWWLLLFIVNLHNVLNQLNTFFINCILNNTPAWSRLTKQSNADFEGYLPSLLSIDKQWQQMSSFHYLLVKYQFKFKNKDYGKTSMDVGLLSLSMTLNKYLPNFLISSFHSCWIFLLFSILFSVNLFVLSFQYNENI